jgi:hypothetical protein
MPFRRHVARLRSSLDPERAPRRNLRVGVVLLSVIVVSARLALPQPIAPTQVPLPAIDAAAAQREAEQHLRSYSSSVRQPLSLQVRAVGEWVRRLGALEAQLDRTRAAERGESRESHAAASKELKARARALVESGQGKALLELRALQTELFLQALVQPEQAGVGLEELAGSLVQRLPRALLATLAADELVRDELGAAYRRRWTELVGLETHWDFTPSLTDARLNARLRLRLAERLQGAERHALQAKVVADLAAVDGSYPAEFAWGVAAFLAGSHAEALGYFNRHRELHPDGPWALRARHHAHAAAAFLVAAP